MFYREEPKQVANSCTNEDTESAELLVSSTCCSYTTELAADSFIQQLL
jgi:hypothetical protein